MRIIPKVLIILLFIFSTSIIRAQEKDSSSANFIETGYDSWGVDKKNNSFEDSKRKSLFFKDLKVKGVIRFVSHYRVMQTYYADMISADKNLAFLDYSNVDAYSSGGNTRIQPLLDLRIEGKVNPTTIFRVGYSFSHSFLGLKKDSSRAFTVRQLLNFEGLTNTRFGTFKLTAGGGTTFLSMSPLTLSRRRYRDEASEKVPWERYTNSPKKYNDYY